MTHSADNDNTPTQVELSGMLRHQGIWFPVSELEDFIEYDIKFGREIYEYPTIEDGMLRSGGSAIKFYDESGRQVWAAVIAESGDDEYASEWRVETYRYKSEACAAMERAHREYQSDYDYGDDDDYEVAA